MPGRGLWIFLGVFTLYFSLPKYSGSLDTVPQVSTPLSLFNSGDFYFDEFVTTDLSKNPHWFTQSPDGRMVSSYPILPGLLNIPVVGVADLALGSAYAQEKILELSQISAALLSALSVLLLYLYLLRSGRYCALTVTLVTLAFALGTAVWSVNAGGLWNQTASLVCFTLVLYLSTFPARWPAVLMGLVVALAFFNRMSSFLIFAAVVGPYFIHHRSLIKFVLLGALIGALPFAWYNQVCYGSIFQLNYGGGQQGAGSFNLFAWEGLLGIFINPNRGLLVYSPIVIPALWQAGKTLVHWRKDIDQSFLAAALFITLAVYGFWRMWWGGHSYGYRIISDLTPVLMVFLATYFESIRWRSATVGLWGTVLAVSIFINGLGAFTYPCGYDSVPNNIDRNTDRLWDIKDGQIWRCLQRLGQ